MHPQDYPTEAVPLQGVSHDEFEGQPGVVEHTAVNINTELPVATYFPSDHIIWSLCCLIYANPFCLGLAALIYSVKARDRKLAGDLDGAQHYGSIARRLNIAATIIFAAGVLILITTVAVTAIYLRYRY